MIFFGAQFFMYVEVHRPVLNGVGVLAELISCPVGDLSSWFLLAIAGVSNLFVLAYPLERHLPSVRMCPSAFFVPGA